MFRPVQGVEMVLLRSLKPVMMVTKSMEMVAMLFVLLRTIISALASLDRDQVVQSRTIMVRQTQYVEMVNTNP